MADHAIMRAWADAADKMQCRTRADSASSDNLRVRMVVCDELFADIHDPATLQDWNNNFNGSGISDRNSTVE